MHVGLCLLRLPPDRFWALTPREFMAMGGALRPRAAGLSRDGLFDLMRDFPDQPISVSNEGACHGER
jgi:uncharacterized phage protein (TIGR02216 family)